MKPNETKNTSKREALYVEDLAKSPPGTRTCVIENSNTSEEIALSNLYEAIVSGSRIWSSSVLSSRAAEAEKRRWAALLPMLRKDNGLLCYRYWAASNKLGLRLLLIRLLRGNKLAHGDSCLSSKI